MFDIVVAVDLDWGLGKDHGLPWPRLRGDLQHFKRTTSTASPGRRNAIVMGRKTWESAEVAGKPLPNRLNVVVSTSPLSVPAGVIAARTIDEALALDNTALPFGSAASPGAELVAEPETIFVVGGAGLLRAVIDRADLRYVYLTRIAGRFDCDVRMPDLDAKGFVPTAWDGERSAEDNGVTYRIERLAPPPTPRRGT